jgi:hypothetical protein
MRNIVTKTYTVRAPVKTLVKFEKFLGLLHYNGGHSGIFGMEFDGDGADRLKVEPEPVQINNDHHHIADSGMGLEVAYETCYKAFKPDRDGPDYKAENGKLFELGQAEKLVRDFNR